MPIVRQLITEVMGKEPDFSTDPMEAVAIGATIQAMLTCQMRLILLLHKMSPHII